VPSVAAVGLMRFWPRPNAQRHADPSAVAFRSCRLDTAPGRHGAVVVCYTSVAQGRSREREFGSRAVA